MITFSIVALFLGIVLASTYAMHKLLPQTWYRNERILPIFGVSFLIWYVATIPLSNSLFS